MSLHKEISFETEICQHLASNGWLDTKTQRAGDLFQDNRTALISAAVTARLMSATALRPTRLNE